MPSRELKPFIKLLVFKLQEAISLDPGGYSDTHSSLWRPSVEDSLQNWDFMDVKDLLVTWIRDLTTKYLTHVNQLSGNNLSDELNSLFHPKLKASIFRRLKLHYYCLFPTDFRSEIDDTVISFFDDFDAFHEYSVLISGVFGMLSNDIKDKYLGLVLKGPEDDRTERQLNAWQVRRLALIKQHLSPSWAQQFEEILNSTPVPDEPTFLATHSTIAGAVSPVSKDELMENSVDEILKFLRDWKPPSESRRLHVDGLGPVFTSLVQSRPDDFSKNAESFKNPDIKTGYLYNYFTGLGNALDENHRIEWQPVLALIEFIISQHRGKSPMNVENSESDFSPDIDSVFSQIARLLEKGLSNDSVAPEFNLRDMVFQSIKYLCEHSDPTPESEEKYGGDNMNPYELSINTVRGVAFHALFYYVFWCNRNLKSDQNDRDIIVDEAKSILEDHLDIDRDPSFAVRSVYGRFFPWMYLHDREWSGNLIDKIFPSESQELRYAAWIPYLANNLFPDVFTALAKVYRISIEELPTLRGKDSGLINPAEGLARHIMIAYLYGMDDQDNYLTSMFFNTATPEQRGMAISDADDYPVADKNGDDKKQPKLQKYEDLWETRIKKSNDVEELKEFGWWVKVGKYDDEWMLKMLNKTLDKTDGVIDIDFRVFEVLDVLTLRYPYLVISALSKMIKSKSTEFHSYIREKEVDSILRKVIKSNNQSAKEVAETTIEVLLKMGYIQFRELINDNTIEQENDGQIFHN